MAAVVVGLPPYAAPQRPLIAMKCDARKIVANRHTVKVTWQPTAAAAALHFCGTWRLRSGYEQLAVRMYFQIG